jgi:hypothetical protein
VPSTSSRVCPPRRHCAANQACHYLKPEPLFFLLGRGHQAQVAVGASHARPKASIDLPIINDWFAGGDRLLQNVRVETMGGSQGLLRSVAPLMHGAPRPGVLPSRGISVVAWRTVAMYCRLRHTVVTATVITPLLGLATQPGNGAERPRTQLAARSFELVEVSMPRPEPLKLPGSALEPIDWNTLDGWAVDDHAAAFATFLASCRPLVRTMLPKGETRPMYFALTHVCRQALATGRLAEEQARMFFENNFRPLRITKLSERAGFLTGYYEPIVDGSRFPTGIFKVPIYRRPRDLVPPLNATGPGFPNRGQSLRRTSSGQLVPYYDRGEILKGALDGQHLEICWVKDPMDALLIQIEGSARVRLEH